MTFTVTIPWWVPVGYLAIGIVLWLPLEYASWRSVQRADRTTFARDLWRFLKARPWVPLAMMLAWPLALYEELT